MSSDHCVVGGGHHCGRDAACIRAHARRAASAADRRALPAPPREV